MPFFFARLSINLLRMNEQAGKLHVGLISPYAWTSSWGVNRHIAGLARALSVQGHSVCVIVPAEERSEPRTRRRSRRAGSGRLVSSGTTAPLAAGQDPGAFRLIKISGTFRFPYSQNLANLALPLDVTEQLKDLLSRESFDLLHVHEPYPPSLSFSALRLAQSPVVATFHTGGERFLSYQLLRPVVERFFSRLDGRICTSQNTRRIVSSYFPGEYAVISGGIDASVFQPPPARRPGGHSPLVAFAAFSEPRRGMSLLARTLRLLPDDVPSFELAVVGGRGLSRRRTTIIPRRLRGSVSFWEPVGTMTLPDIYRQADLLIAPFATSGQASAVLEAMACATAVIVPGQGGMKELVSEGTQGLLLDHANAYSTAAGLMDLLLNPKTMYSMGAAAARKAGRDSWEKAEPAITRVYARAHRRRLTTPPHSGFEPGPRGETILADLHMHTSYSSDCRTSPAELLTACEESGLKAIAITDHNCIAGALEVARLAPKSMHVIVGEEIKTDAGEIIGLYLREEIPKGLGLEETIQRIKDQAGLVYVPHPFDPLHKTPSYESLARNAADIDIIEVYNPRITFVSFNEKAQRLARKYDIPGAAGSDCHVAQGIGTAMISLRRFNGPRELLLSLHEADIIRSRVSPMYLHSLKLLQNGRGATGTR
ncbi:MAG: glycosyltransferase [Thermoleophilia bacterium]